MMSLMMIQPSSTVVSTTTMTIIAMRLNTMKYSNFLRKACIAHRIIGDVFGCQGGFHFQMLNTCKSIAVATDRNRAFLRLANKTWRVFKEFELRPAFNVAGGIVIDRPVAVIKNDILPQNHLLLNK